MKKISIVALAIGLITLLVLSGNLIETNKAGHFQVKQAWITGIITVRTAPGTYWQGFGKITEYKNVATVGFGREKGEGTADIIAIPVIFNDGAKAEISGLVRIGLPNTINGGNALIREYSMGYDHFIQAGILPVIRNAVKLSANLRSAQDAYTTLALFQQAVEDQLIHGTYVTKSDVIEVTRSTGDVEYKKVTKIVLNDDGLPKRVPNRLSLLDCEVLQCVVDVPSFDASVDEMISKRKAEAMKTELAKQEAIRAKQDAITAMEQGKADVAKSKYEEEVIKIKAVVEAQKLFEVAALNAKKALEEKKQKIAIAQGIKQELLIADGLSERERFQINANIQMNNDKYEHMSKWVGPRYVMSGGSSGKDGSNGLENVLMLKMMMELDSKTNK